MSVERISIDGFDRVEIRYQTFVLAIVLIWGVVDTITAMYAVSLNWLFESGLVLSYVLDHSGLGARQLGPLAVLAVKLPATIFLYASLRVVEPVVRLLPFWRALMAAWLAIATYGPFSNVWFILGIWGFV